MTLANRNNVAPEISSGNSFNNLLQEVERLKAGNFDDFALLDFVRHWLYQRIPMAAQAECAIDATRDDFASIPLDTLFDIFAHDHGAMWANGTATTLARVYQHLGYRSATLSICNTRGMPSHTVTLVDVPDFDGPRYFVQDAYFNYTVEREDKRPVEIRDLVGMLVSRDSGNLGFSCTTKHPKARVLQNSIDGSLPFTRISTHWHWFGGPAWDEWLLAKAGTTNPLYNFAFPLEVGTVGDEDPAFDDLSAELFNITKARDFKREERLLNLAACHSDSDYEREVVKFSSDEIRDLYSGDPWLQNYVVSIWEYATGQTRLTSHPWQVSLVNSDVCNAKCHFCPTPGAPARIIELDTLKKFAPVLEYAKIVGMSGPGEPLVHPEFRETLEFVRDIVDPRCGVYIITNGALIDTFFDTISSSVSTVNISLNAASAETHQEIMALGPNTFDRIVRSISSLIEESRRPGARINYVNLSFVVCNQNLHEVPRFIELAEELGVHGAFLRTLITYETPPPGMNYHVVAPYLNADYERLTEQARTAITAAQARGRVSVTGDVDSWARHIVPPDVENAMTAADLPLLSPKERKNAFRVFGGLRPQALSPSEISNINRYLEFNAQIGQGTGNQIDIATGRIRWPDGSIEPPCSRPTDPNEANPDAIISLATVADVSKTSQLGESECAPLTAPPTPDAQTDADIEAMLSYDRKPRFNCKFVYFNFQFDMEFTVLPCCYKSSVQFPDGKLLKYDGTGDFMKVWNSDPMVALRHMLVAGPIRGECQTCPPQDTIFNVT